MNMFENENDAENLPLIKKPQTLRTMKSSVTSNSSKDKNCFNKIKDTAVFKASMFGLNGLFFATHLVINGKFLVSLESDGSSASSLVSSYLSVILGASVGFVLATGLNVGPLVGKKEMKKAGEVAKVASIISIGCGISASILMVATRGVFPYLFTQSTAKIASDFLSGYSIGTTPLMLSIEGLQLAFIGGDWFIPPLSMLLVASISGGLSYWLGFKTSLGAFGIGLGGSIGNIIVATIMGAWLIRNKYKEYALYQCGIANIKTKAISLLGDGWKLALQRLTEWLNLFIITTIIGIKSNSVLKALNAAMLSQLLFGIASQSFGQATGMLTAENRGTMDKSSADASSASKEVIVKCHNSNIKILTWGTLCAFITNTIIAISLSFTRKYLSELLLSNTSTSVIASSSENDVSISQLSENLIWINAIGLVADSLRITLSGSLRGWKGKDLLIPTIISFSIMTLIGIPSGYGMSLLLGQDLAESMLWSRNVAMLISALLIGIRCYNRIKNDEATYNISTNRPDDKPLLESKKSQRKKCYNFIFFRSATKIKDEADLDNGLTAYSNRGPGRVERVAPNT